MRFLWLLILSCLNGFGEVPNWNRCCSHIFPLFYTNLDCFMKWIELSANFCNSQQSRIESLIVLMNENAVMLCKLAPVTNVITFLSCHCFSAAMGGACDPIEEHFRRSLGKNYPECLSLPSRSATASPSTSPGPVTPPAGPPAAPLAAPAPTAAPAAHAAPAADSPTAVSITGNYSQKRLSWFCFSTYFIFFHFNSSFIFYLFNAYCWLIFFATTTRIIGNVIVLLSIKSFLLFVVNECLCDNI